MAALKHPRALTTILDGTGLAIYAGNVLYKIFNRRPTSTPLNLQPRLIDVATGAKPNLRYRNHDRLLTWEPDWDFQKPIPRPLAAPQRITLTTPRVIYSIERINTLSPDSRITFSHGKTINEQARKIKNINFPKTQNYVFSANFGQKMFQKFLIRSYIDFEGFLCYRDTRICELAKVLSPATESDEDLAKSHDAILQKVIDRDHATTSTSASQHLITWVSEGDRRKTIENYFAKKAEQCLNARLATGIMTKTMSVLELVLNRATKELIHDYGFGIHSCFIHQFDDLSNLFLWRFTSGASDYTYINVSGPHEEDSDMKLLGNGRSSSGSMSSDISAGTYSTSNSTAESTTDHGDTSEDETKVSKRFCKEAHKTHKDHEDESETDESEILKINVILDRHAADVNLVLLDPSDRETAQGLHPDHPVLKLNGPQEDYLSSVPRQDPHDRSSASLLRHLLHKATRERTPVVRVEQVEDFADDWALSEGTHSPATSLGGESNESCVSQCEETLPSGSGEQRWTFGEPEHPGDLRDRMNYLMDVDRDLDSADSNAFCLTAEVQQEWSNLVTSNKRNQKCQNKAAADQSHERPQSYQRPREPDINTLDEQVFLTGQLHGIRKWIAARCLLLNLSSDLKADIEEIVDDWSRNQLKVQGHDGVYPREAIQGWKQISFAPKSYCMHYQTTKTFDRNANRSFVTRRTYATRDGMTLADELPYCSEINYHLSEDRLHREVVEWTATVPLVA